jgi:putative two-component system response regulator
MRESVTGEVWIYPATKLKSGSVEMNLPVILCVDDEAIILLSLQMELEDAFRETCDIKTAGSGREALSILHDLIENGRDIVAIVCDQKMPDINGDELIVQARAKLPETDMILITGFRVNDDAIMRAINKAGVYRYLVKPIDINDLKITLRGALREFHQRSLITQKNRTIEKLTVGIVGMLESVNSLNDRETGIHVHRVSEYSAVLARACGSDDLFVQRIRLFSSLHDIGKIGVSREVLLKPGKYTADEFDQMKKHVVIGGILLDNDEFDPMAKNIALYHHERWDGGGYITGLRGEEIPFEARIVAVADVFDALTADRPYKKAMGIEEASGIIRDESGTHFDPQMTKVFFDSLDEIISLKESIGELRAAIYN